MLQFKIIGINRKIKKWMSEIVLTSRIQSGINRGILNQNDSVIKVLHIVLGLQVGGLEKFVLTLIDKSSIYIKPFIVCLEGKGELGQQSGTFHVVEINKAPGFSVKIIRRLVSLTRELEIDIIHTHNPGPHLYGAIAGFLTHVPVVHTKHGRNYPTDMKKVLLNRLSSFFTSKIVAVSQNAAEVCLDIEKISASKVTVILNGVDTEIFHPPESKDEKVLEPVRIGIVARLSAEKDHQTLLNACRLLAGNTTRFHLEIIGDGPLRILLEKTVKDFGIEEFVSFCGMRHDVPEQLRRLDIFVLSSTTEGTSLTLLEAMATGLPVVATNVGGNPEVVVDGITGYIVPPKDPAEMACKLIFLLNNDNLRRQIGKEGRNRVFDKFSIKETARQYEKLYRSVMYKR